MTYCSVHVIIMRATLNAGFRVFLPVEEAESPHCIGLGTLFNTMCNFRSFELLTLNKEFSLIHL
jgi:hypothetical protein